MIRILVVEDSPVQRDFLIDLLEQAGDFQVVGIAADGAEALARIERLQPDIVLMDCHMPGMHGVEATRLVMQRWPTPIVIASASLDARAVELTFDAIRHGALAVVVKPTASGTPAHDHLVNRLLRVLRLMAEVKVVRRWPQRETGGQSAAPHRAAPATTKPAVIAIAGSTGAPGVLGDILAPLQPARTPPILAVQHLAEGFVDGLVRWLEGRTALSVRLAERDVIMEPGHVYIAPDGCHLGVSRMGRIELTPDPAEDGFRPSATHLLRSVAHVYGPRSMGILLSGMGRDGATGLLEMHKAGGVTVVQDKASCVVFGMPGEAVRLGAADHVLAPAAIAQLIQSLHCPEMEEKNARQSQLHGA